MQTAYMPATTTTQPTWRPRMDPSNISTANASMPPHPPQGYQGPWPPPYPPGYPGPPPAQLPSSVSAQQWTKGQWRFDPRAAGWSSASGAPPQPPHQPQQQYYNPGALNNSVPRPASQQAGGPPGWGQQNWVPQGWQMPADHNPYKRMPKEPDPSYFSVELSANPLGLENMHITRKSRPQEKPFTTPWRWVPEDLPPSDDEEDESTPQSGRRPSSRDDPSPTKHHHVSSASQQVSGYPPHNLKLQQYSSSREAEQYRLKGAKSPPIRESDQHRPDTQPTQTTSSPSRDNHVNSSSTAAYPSSRRNTQERTPPKDASHYRSSARRHAQEYTPPSDSSPHRTSSRRYPQEYTPPSDDQTRPPGHTRDDRSRRESERDQDRERNRRDVSDSDDPDHEAFSRKKELHPTFSPAIVRTPGYYSERTSTPSNATPTKPPPTRRASDGPGVPSHGPTVPQLTRVLQESALSVLSPLIGATPRPSSATMPSVDKVSRGELSSSSSSSSPSSSKDRPSHSHSRNHSRSNSLSKVDDKPHRSLRRGDTITSRTMSPTRYDERTNPPTYYTSSSSASMQQSSRAVGRSQTYPTLDPVTENPYPSARRDSRDGRESRNPPAGISRASDAAKDPARSSSRTVGRSYTDPHPARATSPLRVRSPTRALSPPRSATPSRSSSRVPSRSHTPTSSGVVAPPVPVPSLPAEASYRYRTPAPRKVTVRKGYWNRRGDCLTSDRKYFVRAPHKYQYPKEFSHYTERDFFRYDGKKIPWDPEMRESPDTLPTHDRLPRYPFESFLRYTEVDESDVWRAY